MKNLKLKLVLGLSILLVSGTFLSLESSIKQEKSETIQLAILLDTSGSMQGLIEQAKTQLWKIVNELATAKRKGISPNLEVALYEYGKSSIPASEGYLRMLVPLSNDLDKISEELFKLRTNGGDEYCGAVIDSAVKGLKWSKSNKEYKVIFIAGNEPFTQGKVSYKTACKTAISNGIIINTIFCGNYNSGIRTKWKDGADLADGKYMNIDHNRKVVHISAPQDAEIIKLGGKLNQTYIAYGAKGKKLKERQRMQDKNAMKVNPAVMVQRSVTKSSGYYKNKKWDMVDAEEEGAVNLETIKNESLPEEMKNMTLKEKKAYIKKKNVERKEIQKKIKELKVKRDKFVAEKRKKNSDGKTLDSAIINAIKKQAEKKKYKFEKK